MISAKALPLLLALLDSNDFREQLRECCATVANWTAGQSASATPRPPWGIRSHPRSRSWAAGRLLEAARANAEVAELTHQFGHVTGVNALFPDMTVRYGLVASHFVTTAQVRARSRPISGRSRADLAHRSRAGPSGAFHRGRRFEVQSDIQVDGGSFGGDVRDEDVRPAATAQAYVVGRRLGARDIR